MTRHSPISRRHLHTGWTVEVAAGRTPEPVAGRAIPAKVPGVVHLDLLSEGLIDDPYLDDNEALQRWIGLTDWTYRTRFEVDPAEMGHERHELVFEGLDTVARVHLNGRMLAETANQHRTHRLDVTEPLRAGTNEIVVEFASPVRYANRMSSRLGMRERPYPYPYEAIRKSACSFGWDWGIATATSGIWRPVSLESWSTARLERVLLSAVAEADGGRVEARVRLARTSVEPLQLRLQVAGVETVVEIPVGVDEATAVVQLDSVDRWWPVGYGKPRLYEVTVGLAAGGVIIDSAHRRVGFRSLRWDMNPDGEGTPFQLVVNDQPVFVKGVNWIPDDALFPRVDRARYRRRLAQARDANLNLVRVWGGGMYEDDAFYDACDELGLLTWQDFLFACAAYPEEEPILSEVKAEAADNVARIAHHASLVLLTGNNENLMGWDEWGWQERLDGKTWGSLYYFDVLPSIVSELAPHVPYAPGSPFSPVEGPANDPAHGTVHLWEQWNRQDWRTYADEKPRFVAEFGWQGPPTWSTLTQALSDDPLTPESPGMVVHQKAVDGNVKLTQGLVPHYRVPADMEEWHWAMQLNQANAVGFALDHFRSMSPYTSGAVVWQLNDCWPVTSWAAVDGQGRVKPLWFALRNSFAPRRVALVDRAGSLVVALTNDTPARWQGELSLRRLSLAGDVLESARVPVALSERETLTAAVPDAVVASGDPAGEILIAELDGQRAVRLLTEPRESRLAPEPGLAVEVTESGQGHRVSVTATGSVVLDLMLLVDKVAPDATVDSGLLTLLPGETHVFDVVGSAGADASSFSDPRVLRSGNQLVVNA